MKGIQFSAAQKMARVAEEEKWEAREAVLYHGDQAVHQFLSHAEAVIVCDEINASVERLVRVIKDLEEKES